MKFKEAMRRYDYDLPLMDALNDPELSPNRRVLAGATMWVSLDTAYFAVSEMLEAFVALADDQRRKVGIGEGYLAIEEILNAKNPFQMRLWHLLDQSSLDQVVSDLSWLRQLTYQRGQMAQVLRDAKLPISYATAEDMREGMTAVEIMALVVPPEFR